MPCTLRHATGGGPTLRSEWTAMEVEHPRASPAANALKSAVVASKPLEVLHITIATDQPVDPRHAIERILSPRLGPDDFIVADEDSILVVFGPGHGQDVGQERDRLRNTLARIFTAPGQINLSAFRLDPKVIDQAPGRVSSAAVVGFAPVWSVAQEALNAYYATPQHPSPEGLQYGYSESYRILGAHDVCDFLDLDLQTLRRAVSGLVSSRKKGTHSVVGYTVHATTLRHPERRRIYQQQLALVPAALRRYTAAKIAEIERNEDRESLKQWVRMLQSASSRVSLEFHPQERRLDGLANTGAWGAGLILPPSNAANPQAMAARRDLIVRWNIAAKRQSMKLFLNNVDDAPTFDIACAEGVDFITSCLLWPVVPEPIGLAAAPRIEARQAFADQTNSAAVIEADQKTAMRRSILL